MTWTETGTWRLPDDFWTLTPQGLGAEVVYEGPFPPKPTDYYALAHGRAGYVYILSGTEPVYVGRSTRPGNRFDRHRQRPWWPEVENVTILGIPHDSHGTEAKALTDLLETFTIRRLRPRHNVAKALT